MEQKISHLLKSAVISLCTQHYTEKLEVDGIICISSQQSSLQHVIKIHQAVDPSNSHYGEGIPRDSSPAPASKSGTPWIGQQKKAGIPPEKIKSRKRSRNTEDSDPDFNCSVANSVDNFPTIVKQLHKRKSRSQKISTYTEYDTEGSESPGYGSDAQDGRYGVNDGSIREEPMGSASVLLKLLAKPHKRSMMANQSNSINPSIEMVNLEGIPKVGMEYQIKLNDGSVSSKEHVSQDEDGSTTSEIPAVKEEPVWDGEYGGTNHQDQNGVSDESKGMDGSAGANSDASLEKNSILMKILEGKSLREAYKAEQHSSPGQPVQNSEEKSKPTEQDNSLLYRLPFVSFQDLFPQNSQDILPNENNSAGKGGLKKPLTLQTLEYTKTGAVQTPPQGNVNTPTQKTSPEQKYSTRLSSGKKNPISYQEMLGTVSYSSDDEKDQGEKDADEEMYTPQQSEYQVISQESEITENTTGAKRRKMGPRCKVGGKQEDSKGSNGGNPEKPRPTVVCSNDRFECSICGRIFSSRALRDMHEDAERAEHFFKCPLCDGFFGSEESKLIHMQDRHGIATKEFAEERATKKVNLAKNKSVIRKKEAMQMKKSVLCQEENREEYEDKDSKASSPETFSIEIKQEKTEEYTVECDMCDMKFLGQEELQAHTQTFHGAV